MTPNPLYRSYIGIKMYQDGYIKVKGLLPTPSYTTTLSTYNNQKIILIYAIEGYITSHNQYRWISNIKIGLEKYLCVPFTYEEDCHISDETDISNILYTIDELSKAFKAPLTTYPKIMYPSNKKELYRNLCWYGKRLVHKKCFTKEAMISTALLMNLKLGDKYSNKELYKKALGAYMFIDENRENFSIKLDNTQLKEAHSKGGKIRKMRQLEDTKEKIDKLLEDDIYIKPNGKVNKTLLAKTLDMNRRSLDKYFP